MHATDVKVFVPAQDFETSLAFYQALGWKLNWRQGGLAELELGNVRFLLQDFYVKQWAHNFMLYIDVTDAQAWYEHISRIINTGDFGSARLNPPKEEAYGALVTYVWDPCGVLLHFAEPLTPEAEP